MDKDRFATSAARGERFAIDEPTADIPARQQTDAQQGAFGYDKRVDAHRLAAVSKGGGW